MHPALSTVFPHTHWKSTYIFHILLFGLACPPTPLVIVFGFLLVRQIIPPELTIHTLAVSPFQIYSIYFLLFPLCPGCAPGFRFRV